MSITECDKFKSWLANLQQPYNRALEWLVDHTDYTLTRHADYHMLKYIELYNKYRQEFLAGEHSRDLLTQENDRFSQILERIKAVQAVRCECSGQLRAAPDELRIGCTRYKSETCEFGIITWNDIPQLRGFNDWRHQVMSEPFSPEYISGFWSTFKFPAFVSPAMILLFLQFNQVQLHNSTATLKHYT